MKIIKYLLLCTIAQPSFSAPIVLTVGPAADTDCQFNSIQAAIDSPNANMDIRLSNQLSTTDGIVIQDKDISFLRGGYFNCQDAANDILDISTPFTTISNNASVAILIKYLIDIAHTITLLNLDINNSVGGVKVENGGTNTILNVNFAHVDIFNNTESGLHIFGTDITINFDHGEIANNTTEVFGLGAGVKCSNSEIQFGEFTAIHGNEAAFGGGVFSSNCSLTLLSGDNNPLGSLQYGIFSNTATNSGGGLYLDQSSLVAVGSINYPVSITNNNLITTGALVKGGGIFLNSNSTANLTNLRLDHNSTVGLGAAITAIHNNLALNPPLINVSRHLAGCNYNSICNSIGFNHDSGLAFGNDQGAAIFLQGSTANILHTKFEGNTASTSSIFKVKADSQLNLFSDLLVNNSTQGDFFDLEDQSSLIIKYSTFADNSLGNHFNVQYDNANGQLLEVTSSIIKNGNSTIANLNNDMGDHDAQVNCSLVENDDASGVAQSNITFGLPGFVGNGNYQLQEDSIAKDPVCTSILGEFDPERFDILNFDRNSDGKPDFGAYELDSLFNNGFE